MPHVRKLEALFDVLQKERGEAELEPPTLREWIDLATAWRIVEALRQHGGNRSAAARSLGIGRRTLYTKMERLGIHAVWTAGREDDSDGAATDSSGEEVAGPSPPAP